MIKILQLIFYALLIAKEIINLIGKDKNKITKLKEIKNAIKKAKKDKDTSFIERIINNK